VTSCRKGLVTCPCGGTNHGKCEIDVDKEEAVCDGVHIMAIGKEETVPDIMSAAGLM
jgi:5,10-methylenetetrahydrofolate reductase